MVELGARSHGRAGWSHVVGDALTYPEALMSRSRGSFVSGLITAGVATVGPTVTVYGIARDEGQVPSGEGVAVRSVSGCSRVGDWEQGGWTGRNPWPGRGFRPGQGLPMTAAEKQGGRGVAYPAFVPTARKSSIARATASGSTFRSRRPRRISAQFFRMCSACRLPVRAKYWCNRGCIHS